MIKSKIIVPEIAMVLEFMELVELILVPEYFSDATVLLYIVIRIAFIMCIKKMASNPNSITRINGFTDSNISTIELKTSGLTNNVKLLIKCINKKKHNKMPVNAI